MLENKVAIITGGSRGIGLETVRLFKKNKAEVVLFGSKKDSVDKAVADLKSEGLEVTGYYPNLNDYEEIERIIAEINNKYGHIDILINNAGMSARKSIEDTTTEEFESIMDLNINGVFNVSKAIVPYMKKNNGDRRF